MFYYLYEIKNNLNGKIYIGVHKTKSLDDKYMGSGKVINQAIEKYGIENFTKIILEQFTNSTAMYAKEKEIVTDEFLVRKDVYNLRCGGTGGFDYINKNRLNDRTGAILTTETKDKISIGKKESITDEYLQSLSERSKGNTYNPKFSLNGKDHPASGTKTDNHLNKIRHSIQKLYDLGHYDQFKNNSPLYITGNGHPQFGTMWITNGLLNKRIKKANLIPEGWRKGRIFLRM